MKLLQLFLFIAILIFCSAFAPAAGYKIGDEVADFSLKSVTGKMVSMADYKGAKGFVVIFTCNHCPYAKRYQERLNLLSKKYARLGIQLLAISATDPTVVPMDSYENMVVAARQGKYTYPYLYDETQAVAKAFNAAKTPHAFVLFKSNGKWILRYSGAIDDNGADAVKVKNHYLEDAVDALIAGKPIAAEVTKSVGCPIKWKGGN